MLVLGALAAIFSILVSEKVANKKSVDRSIRALWAHLFAIRLYSREPAIVLQSFLGLIRGNTELIFCLVPVLVILSPLFLAAYPFINDCFNPGLLPLNHARVITVQLGHLDQGWPDVQLQAPGWIKIESPPVHVWDTQEISWSLRATQRAKGILRITIGGETITKVVDSDTWPTYVSPMRSQHWPDLLKHAAESLLPDGVITKVSILEPPRSISWLGIELDWTWWFVILSTLLVLPAKWLIGLCRLRLIGPK